MFLQHLQYREYFLQVMFLQHLQRVFSSGNVLATSTVQRVFSSGNATSTKSIYFRYCNVPATSTESILFRQCNIYKDYLLQVLLMIMQHLQRVFSSGNVSATSEEYFPLIYIFKNKKKSFNFLQV